MLCIKKDTHPIQLIFHIKREYKNFEISMRAIVVNVGIKGVYIAVEYDKLCTIFIVAFVKQTIKKKQIVVNRVKLNCKKVNKNFSLIFHSKKYIDRKIKFMVYFLQLKNMLENYCHNNKKRKKKTFHPFLSMLFSNIELTLESVTSLSTFGKTKEQTYMNLLENKNYILPRALKMTLLYVCFPC